MNMRRQKEGKFSSAAAEVMSETSMGEGEDKGNEGEENMETLTVTLKTVTPLFLAGADGRTPELRAPSIKGMMRFWWRAMKVLSIEELRKEEGDLFGSSDEGVGRSKFALSVRKNDEIEVIPYQPLPHHTGDKLCPYLKENPSCNRDGRCSKGNKPNAIAPNQKFECIIRANTVAIKKVEDILKVSLILGGLGKRSRRGFGSIKIIKENDSDFSFDYSLTSIRDLLNTIVPQGYKTNGSKIEKDKPALADSNYPYIKEIEIGNGCKKYEDLLKVIGRASHKNDCKYTGFALGQDRLASPIYVSIIKDGNDYKPIITRLHPAFKNPLHGKEKDNSVQFICDILNNAGGCK